MKRSDNKPLGCGFCPYKTNSACHLERHLRIHTGQKPYACNTCDYRATDGGLLKRHMRIHSGEKPFKCHICGHQTAQSCSLKDHMAVHTGKKRYACDQCPFQCSRIGRLRDHQIQHKLALACTNNMDTTGETSNETEVTSDQVNLPNTCPICELEFSEPLYLRTHIAAVHESEPTNVEVFSPSTTLATSVDRSMDDTHNNPFTCNLCSAETDSLDELNTHTSRHILYKCLKCGNTFDTSEELVTHGYSHNRELLYSCELCDFKSKTRNELRGHERMHNQCQAFMCSNCEFLSKSQREFSQHLQTHTSKDKVQCNICKKSFKDTSALKDHMSFHYGRQRVPKRIIHELQEAEEFLESNSSYLCFYCSLRCPDRQEMETHIQNVHFQSSETPESETDSGIQQNHAESSIGGSVIVHPGINCGSAANPLEQVSSHCESASAISNEHRSEVDTCVQCLKDEGFNYLLKFYTARQTYSSNQLQPQSWFPSHPYDQLLPFFMNENWSDFSHSSHCTKSNSSVQVDTEDSPHQTENTTDQKPYNSKHGAESDIDIPLSTESNEKNENPSPIEKAKVITAKHTIVAETACSSKAENISNKRVILSALKQAYQNSKFALTNKNSNETKVTKTTTKYVQLSQAKPMRTPTKRQHLNQIQIARKISKPDHNSNTGISFGELQPKNTSGLLLKEYVASGDKLIAKLRKFFNESVPPFEDENSCRSQSNSMATQAPIIDLCSATNSTSSKSGGEEEQMTP